MAHGHTPPARERGAPITLVSGLPRSGTSLMMQILGAAGVPLLCDAVRPPDASNPRGYFELEAVKRTRRDASWVERAPGHAVKVIHALLADLPRDRDYRVVWMERPVVQVVASQDAMLARLGHADDDLPPGALERILAAQAARARALLEEEDCFTWIRVRYPDLLRRPRPTLATLRGFLDLGAPPEVLATPIDPALHRSRWSDDVRPGGRPDTGLDKPEPTRSNGGRAGTTDATEERKP